MDLQKELPFLTKDIKGIGGKIKEKPEYFIVEEIPLYNAEGEGEHLYVNIIKENLTTPELQKKISKLFNIPLNDVGYAGIKDKHARTTQTFSIRTGIINEKQIEQIKSEIEDKLSVKVNWTSPHKNKLKIGHLLGNKFIITITDIQVEINEALKMAESISKVVKENGLPNYFGPQRFGIEGMNINRAKQILEGNLIINDKWLKRFLLSSYQSHLCNKYLALRIEKGLFDKILKGDIAKKHDTGGLFLVEDVSEQERFNRKEISFTAPLFGKKMMQCGYDALNLEDELLEKEGLTREKFSKLFGNRRLGRIFVEDIECKKTDEGIQLSFTLPKGAFATTLLREIIKY
jgi:tRNA pseudouridine13 synthase